MRTGHVPLVLQDLSPTRGQVWVDIHVRAELNVSAFVARQKVTGYVLEHVSDHMGSGEPSLVVDGERFLWRVPVHLSVLPHGQLGQVGTIDVDAQTGQLLANPELVEEMQLHAQALVERATASHEANS
jgi:hypothetical protein